jgi:hypothetical protein
VRYNSYLDQLDRLPPNICRLIAREGRRQPLDNAALAARSGLTIERIAYISKLRSWASVTVGEMDAFRTACGISPTNQSRHYWYVRRTFDQHLTIKPLAHLDKLPRRKQQRLTKLV